MRINKFVASATGLSRRAADVAIEQGRVKINGLVPSTGQAVAETDSVQLDGQDISAPTEQTTIMLNKPVGYVCSRDGQGSRTIYDLLPTEYHKLKPIGRLDKDSSGLILLTNDGHLANELTHPRYAKDKIYEISLQRALSAESLSEIIHGVKLEDGLSHLQVRELPPIGKANYQITMQEGRNRQIRRTFFALGYTVLKLRRIKFGDYVLDHLRSGDYARLEQH
jgi:23S rRNA pseudouridine2605 synthase